MKMFTALFLLFLTTKSCSAAPSTHYPAGTCHAEPLGTVCRVYEDNCNPEAFPFPTGSPPDCNCQCVINERPVEICCNTKTVGDYSYTKVSEGKVPPECLKNCIYTRDDKPGSKYCFASGEKEVHCLDKETEQIGPLGKIVMVTNFLGSEANFTIFFQHCNATGIITVGGDRDFKTINIGSCFITKIEAVYGSQTCEAFVSDGTPHFNFEITNNSQCSVDVYVPPTHM